MLSCATLIVCNRIPTKSVADALNSTLTETALWGLLRKLRAKPHWPIVSIALTRLADYLTSKTVPINYSRRRQLDYRLLLKEEDWYRICAALGIDLGGPQAPVAARSYLFSRISGLPAKLATPAELSGNYGFAQNVRDFPLRLTSILAKELDQEARNFLNNNGVTEPLTWCPPLRLLDDLDLPGDYVDKIDLATLHANSRHFSSLPTAIAHTINADVTVVRYLLEKNPLPPSPPTTATAQLRSVLPAEQLRRLHGVEKKTGLAIAEQFGVSYTVLRRLAASYGISFVEQLHSPPRDWLHLQYVVRRRLLTDLADELGVCAPTVAAWIKKAGLQQAKPVYRIPAMSTEHAATFLAPVLAREAGLRSLQNFVAATAHRNLASAANELGLDPTTLFLQVKTLGRDLGGPLLQKARGPLPMAPTPLGTQVLSAVRTYQSSEGCAMVSGLAAQSSECSSSAAGTSNASARSNNLS